VAWARDRLNSEDCVVRFSEFAFDQDRWLNIGALAKLKESKPEESLEYIRANLRGADASQRFWYHLRQEGTEGMRQAWTRWPRFNEMTGIELLHIWAEHPGVADRPDLISKAIKMLPEIDLEFDRSIAAGNLIAQRELQRQQRFEDEFEMARERPWNYRTRSLIDLLVPWESRRRQIMLDYATYLSYQWYIDPSINGRHKIHEQRQKYGVGTAIPFFDPPNPDTDSKHELRMFLEEKQKQAASNADLDESQDD
jgi:hypothetical protein